MHRLAITASTTSAIAPPNIPGIEPATPQRPIPARERGFVVSAVACGLVFHLALAQPSLANSDSASKMVLAGDPSDPLSLAPQLQIHEGDDLGDAIDALFADVPDEEWQKLPENLASRINEILYKRGA